MRATPFFVGLAMSVVNEKLKEKKVKFSQVSVLYRLFYKHLSVFLST